LWVILQTCGGRISRTTAKWQKPEAVRLSRRSLFSKRRLSSQILRAEVWNTASDGPFRSPTGYAVSVSRTTPISCQATVVLQLEKSSSDHRTERPASGAAWIGIDRTPCNQNSKESTRNSCHRLRKRTGENGISPIQLDKNGADIALVSSQFLSFNRYDNRNLGAIRQCQRFLDETHLC
jgi:hypothetical protein